MGSLLQQSSSSGAVTQDGKIKIHILFTTITWKVCSYISHMRLKTDWYVSFWQQEQSHQQRNKHLIQIKHKATPISFWLVARSKNTQTCSDHLLSRVVNFWSLPYQRLPGITIGKNDWPVKVGKMLWSKLFVNRDLFLSRSSARFQNIAIYSRWGLQRNMMKIN